jgi:hypothetical protein
MIESRNTTNFLFQLKLALLFIDFNDESLSLVNEAFKFLQAVLLSIFDYMIFFEMLNDGISAFLKGLYQVIN